MIFDLEQLKDFLNALSSVIMVVSPIVYGLYIKLGKSFIEKKKAVKNAELQVRRDLYKKWEHAESAKMISKIQNLCNYHKDMGAADSVSYFQFENGTTATSKLCNLFVSCLAEDDRYGALKKMLMEQQRVPYSRLASWVDLLENDIVVQGNVDDIKNDAVQAFMIEKGARSLVAESVKDIGGYIIGFCVFEYVGVNQNEQDVESQKKELHEFKVAVRGCFLNFHALRLEKMRELHVNSLDMK